MFRASLSGTKQLDDAVLNRSYISSKIQPYSTNVDIGSNNNRFDNIYSNNYYALLADIGDAEINNLTVGSALTTNIKATKATIVNLRGLYLECILYLYRTLFGMYYFIFLL